MRLDPEQELVLKGALGIGEDGRWQTREVGVNMPRQNGKGEILMARQLFGLFELGERLVIHTAHEFKTSAEHFQRLESVIRDCPELHGLVHRRESGQLDGYRYSHGEESITLQDGARIEFKTRTKSGMRGFSGVDHLTLDEAMIISEPAYSSTVPTIRAASGERGPQIWLTGSAVDQESMDHGIVWTRVRERGMAADDPELAYFEWSVDCEHPDDVSDEMMADPAVWRSVNFAIGRGRVTEKHMDWERRAMSARGFAVELLGAGDYPPTDGAVDQLIGLEEWLALERPEGSAEATMVDPVCLAFDVSPDRRTSICAVGLNERGTLLVDVLATGSGTGWVHSRLVELYSKHDVEQIVCDGYGPSAAIARKVDDAGITVKRLDSQEYGIACGMFVDAVGEDGLRHLGQDEMTLAIRGAKARPLVDRWAWSRTKSNVDISPLVAATLAHWSAVENQVGARIQIF